MSNGRWSMRAWAVRQWSFRPWSLAAGGGVAARFGSFMSGCVYQDRHTASQAYQSRARVGMFVQDGTTAAATHQNDSMAGESYQNGSTAGQVK